MGNNSEQSNNSVIDTAEFVKLLTQNQRKLYSYILKMVGSYHDADDIMQETTSVMWKKLASFEKESNFLGWAVRIAHYNILNYRKSKKLILFDDDVFASIHEKASGRNDILEENLSHLKSCLREMKEKDFKLISLRYIKGYSIKEIAEDTSRSPQSLYRTMGRVHELLMRCINHKRIAGSHE